MQVVLLMMGSIPEERIVMRSQKQPGKGREHILVCLSSSPSNERIVRTAVNMAAVFGSQLTALYVETPNGIKLSDKDVDRLNSNIRIAEEAGANIVRTHGEDIPEQIAEFARLSGITKIVIGINSESKKRLFSKPSTTERLFKLVPGIDIHVIPDTDTYRSYHEKKEVLSRNILPSWKDLAITFALLAAATAIGFLFQRLGFTEANIITVYLLTVLLISILTRGYICGVLSSVSSVILFNYFLTEPRLTLRAYGSGYPVTFVIMLVASVLTGTLAAKLKAQAKLSARDAFRTKLLFDTNRALQGAGSDLEILLVTASQVSKLLELDTVLFPAEDGRLNDGLLFLTGSTDYIPLVDESGIEKTAAEWTYSNKKRSGSGTQTLKRAKYNYTPIRSGEFVYGVLGIGSAKGERRLTENGILQSVLGECALALENHRNAKGREEASVIARNETLRANLLRAISHDLRTPLTAISGNADALLSNSDQLDEETKKSLLADICSDADWLEALVENLLAITRIGDGSVKLDFSDQVVEDVLSEALRHIDKRASDHIIRLDCGNEPLLAKMDARLIIQVIVNLVNNAVKYTPAGSHIIVSASKKEGNVVISVADDGPGISENIKEKVFEMFFTGNNSIGDSRRSLGLGLPLCHSIAEAHNSELMLSDNTPHGCVFSFALPISEVDLNE